jgi:hypothetical protein
MKKIGSFFACAFFCTFTLPGDFIYYNYTLNNNSKYKNKYKLIGNGEKLKIYNCKTPISEVFAYLPGDHPYEIAPKVDYDTQFEKCMIDPLNRVLTAIGLQTLDTNLIYASALF